MADYMTVAHYTDEAIGKFVEYLKNRPEYERTMVVITGDHEGLQTTERTVPYKGWERNNFRRRVHTIHSIELSCSDALSQSYGTD